MLIPLHCASSSLSQKVILPWFFSWPPKNPTLCVTMFLLNSTDTWVILSQPKELWGWEYVMSDTKYTKTGCLNSGKISEYLWLIGWLYVEDKWRSIKCLDIVIRETTYHIIFSKLIKTKQLGQANHSCFWLCNFGIRKEKILTFSPNCGIMSE